MGLRCFSPDPQIFKALAVHVATEAVLLQKSKAIKKVREPPQECVISAPEISAALLCASVPPVAGDRSESNTAELHRAALSSVDQICFRCLYDRSCYCCLQSSLGPRSSRGRHGSATDTAATPRCGQD